MRICWTTTTPAVLFRSTAPIAWRTPKRTWKPKATACSQIHRKGARGKPLTARKKQRQQDPFQNPLPGQAPVCLDGSMGGKAVRCIGLARAEVCIGFMNLAYMTGGFAPSAR